MKKTGAETVQSAQRPTRILPYIAPQQRAPSDMDHGKIVMLVCVSNTATWQYAAAVIDQE